MTGSIPLEGPQAQELRHKTLSAYYTRLHTVHDYLLSFPRSSSSSTALILPTDKEEYKCLVLDTVCALGRDAPVSPPSSGTRGSQQEVVDRIIAEVARRSNREGTKDVLVSGDKYDSSDLPVNVARPGMGGIPSNGPMAILRSRPWKLLRARIGDDAFRHILVHTSIFLPVQNNCYMQLSGVPVYEKYQHFRIGATESQPSMTNPDTVKTKARGRKRKRKSGGEVDRDQGIEVQARKKQRSGLFKRSADRNLIRQKLMYAHPARRPNGSLIHGLPPQHVLNKLSSNPSPSDAACFSLLQTIFPSMFDTKARQSVQTAVPRVKGSKDRIPQMMGATREILVRHRQIDYAKEVWRMVQRLKGSENGELQAVPHGQVCRFARNCLKKVIGPVLLGDERNLGVLLRHADLLIQSKQHENVSIHTVLQGISVNEITWLAVPGTTRPNPQEATKRRRLVEDLISWIMEGYLIPLLRNTFYATETAATRYQVNYFHHEAWSAASRPHFERLQQHFLQELDANERHFAQQGPLGVAAVRLIPKPKGFRPIVNLGRMIRTKTKAGSAPGISITRTRPQSANQILSTVHQVLTFEKDRKRGQLGSCLFGTNEVFGPISLLKAELLRLHGQIPTLYYVKMDIRAAFDTIKQDKMLDIVSDLLDQDHDYCLMLYCLLLPPASKVSQGSARRLFKQRAILDDGESIGFDDHAADIAKPLRNAVLVDLVRKRHVTKESCMQLLRQHIKQNVWQIGSKLFRQKEGIPQGSKISSLLCSVFYASLEKEFLGFVHRPGTRLLRYIDDFLLISNDHATARRFVDIMRSGFPAYGAHIAPGKTLLSFPYISGLGSQVSQTSADGGGNFPFCGFLIDMGTLDISMDHHRLLGNSVQQSFALRSNRHRGSAFVGWLSRQLENRNHVAYLDTRHNDLRTVHLNVFINFALTAMKIPHYFKSEDMSPRRAESIYESLCLAVEYTYIAGRARVKHASRADPGIEHYGVKKSDFACLAKMAMLKVLSKKASRMKVVVDRLKVDLSQRKCRERAEELSGVVTQGMEAVQGAKY